MNNYKVIIQLSNGDEINANVAARNQAHAIERIEKLLKSEEGKMFADFIGDNEITKIIIDNNSERKSVDTENRFLLQQSKEQGKWVATDTVNQVVCIFEEKKFNETHKVSFLNEINYLSALEIATILRELSEWLAKNHPQIV